MGRTFGLMAVDWEQRVDFDRLRRARLDRIKALLEKSELGSLLCFDPNNIRYLTSTMIGTWSNDKFVRWSLLPQGREPIIWDFGSAARHHQLFAPWLDSRSRAGITNFRGGIRPEVGRPQDVAQKIKVELEAAGLAKEPVGVDIVEAPILFALQAAGLMVVDGQQLMLEARMIKTPDELVLLDTSCMMVDAAYDELYKVMGPGMRENECVGLVAKTLYDLGSEHVEGVNAISGERTNPHPHVYSDRVLRPGDPAFFDILHAYTTATGPATTGPSPSAAPRPPWLMPTSAVATISTTPSAGSSRARPRPRSPTHSRAPRTSVFPTRRRASRCSSGTGLASPSGRSR